MSNPKWWSVFVGVWRLSDGTPFHFGLNVSRTEKVIVFAAFLGWICFGLRLDRDWVERVTPE